MRATFNNASLKLKNLTSSCSNSSKAVYPLMRMRCACVTFEVGVHLRSLLAKMCLLLRVYLSIYAFTIPHSPTHSLKCC